MESELRTSIYANRVTFGSDSRSNGKPSKGFRKKSFTDDACRICLASVWRNEEGEAGQEKGKNFFSNPVERNRHIQNMFQ